MKSTKKSKKANNEVTKGIEEVKVPVSENTVVVSEGDFDFKMPTSLNDRLCEILDKNPKHFIGCG